MYGRNCFATRSVLREFVKSPTVGPTSSVSAASEPSSTETLERLAGRQLRDIEEIFQDWFEDTPIACHEIDRERHRPGEKLDLFHGPGLRRCQRLGTYWGTALVTAMSPVNALGQNPVGRVTWNTSGLTGTIADAPTTKPIAKPSAMARLPMERQPINRRSRLFAATTMVRHLRNKLFRTPLPIRVLCYIELLDQQGIDL